MRDTELFQAALALAAPWVVLRSEFDPERKQLDLHIGFARGSRFACPACGAEGCGVHDVREKEWRHLNFFQHKTVLKASIPRISCDKCGVKQVSPPWARAGSGFTLLFEAFLLSMVKAMPVANVAEIVDEHDTRLWRVLDHYVSQAVDRLDLSEVKQIAADETSARRGHDYISLFVDMARRKVVHVADGKDAATVDGFAAFLQAHGGKRENITDVAIDMGAGFIAGVKANFPDAKITFDKFHVIKLVNDAVDEVRRTEAKTNDWIKGTRYLWLKNLQNLDEEEKAAIVRLEAANLDTMQAWQIRMNLQDVFTRPSVASARKFLHRWHAWVSTCDLPPMKKVAATIMAKADEILRSISSNLSNGLLEAINGNVQAAKRKAKGYRTKHNLKLMVYLIAGGVLDALPT
jgi:transposase